MYTLKRLSDIRNLELYLGIRPDEPSCDSYPTVNMTLEQIQEVYHRDQPVARPKGVVIGRYIYDLKTGEMIIEEFIPPVAASEAHE